MYGKKLMIFEKALLIALSVTLFAAAWAQKKQSELSADLIRLHVLAVSDDAREQEIKLLVRDAVTEYLAPMLEDAESSADARRIIAENLSGIEKAAKDAALGRKVSVTLSREYYPTREYESFTLPAGEYESLRVILGDGQGHNWWCVVFPPLCLNAADSERLRGVMDEDEYGMICEQDGYVLRFRILELWGELAEKLR